MIRKYIATTVERAQAKARNALGTDVVVLGIRDLPSGDVEVTAADPVSARAYHGERQYGANPNPSGPYDTPPDRPRQRNDQDLRRAQSPAEQGVDEDSHAGGRAYRDRPPQGRRQNDHHPHEPGDDARRHDDPYGDDEFGVGLEAPDDYREREAQPKKRGPFSFFSRKKQPSRERVEAPPLFEDSGDDNEDGYFEADGYSDGDRSLSAEAYQSRDHQPEHYGQDGYRQDEYWHPNDQDNDQTPDQQRQARTDASPKAYPDDGTYGYQDHQYTDDRPDERDRYREDTHPGRDPQYDDHADYRYDQSRDQDDAGPYRPYSDDDGRHASARDARPRPLNAHSLAAGSLTDTITDTRGGAAPMPIKRAADIPAPMIHRDPQPASARGYNGSGLHEPMEKSFSENALHELRHRLTGSPASAPEGDDYETRTLGEILRSHGVSDRLIAAVRSGAKHAQITDDLYRLGIGLSDAFNFSPLRSTAAVPLMLVGPTGAGKTSCAAKLAALALADGDGAMMITTDVGRAGALEQFATYSQKLNIECYAAETPEEISTIMKEAQPQGAVILDTPGISPYDAGDLAALKSFQTVLGAEPILVLPASGDVGEYSDWAHAFRAFGVRACIITKFDATRRVGAGISAAFEGNMTLTYFSETPFISEGLLPASPEFLAYRLTANYPGRIMQG